MQTDSQPPRTKNRGRPKKKPNFDAEKIMNELLTAVTQSYRSPSIDEAALDDGSHKQLKLVAKEFQITPLKVRKLLITSGAYRTAMSERIAALAAAGYTIAQIQEATDLGRASVYSYLPYTKGVYNADEISTDAERVKLYRARQKTRQQIKETRK
ncbi:MAG: hypothetical protein RSI32_03575 [Clostridia bacterium]